MTDRDYKELWNQTYNGLDLMMEHFRHIHGYRLPRTISTGATSGRQYSVDRRDRIMEFYRAARYEDCRINAYLDFDALKQKQCLPQDYKPTPDYLLIDLDRKSFETDEQLENALQTTLKNIDKNIQGYPSAKDNTTVIWSGNGYHVHVPLEWRSALEDMPEFVNFKDDQDLTTRFLRWVERELTEGMADQHHNPSIKSCLLRVPGTINSKAKAAGKDPFVRVTQVSKWAFVGKHASPDDIGMPQVKNEFLMKFHSMLVQEVIDEKMKKLERRKMISLGLLKEGNNNSLDWIDKLLQIPVQDNRKDLLFWVLAPYLITVKGLDYDKAYSVLEQWLDKCNDVKRLEPDWTSFRYRIRYCLDIAENQERKPIKFDTFKEYYPDVYKSLKLAGSA
jgi:hypothetical protein